MRAVFPLPHWLFFVYVCWMNQFSLLMCQRTSTAKWWNQWCHSWGCIGKLKRIALQLADQHRPDGRMERGKTNRILALAWLCFALIVVWKNFPWKQEKMRIQAQDSVSMPNISTGIFIVMYLYDSLSAVLLSKCGKRPICRCSNWYSVLISDAFCGGNFYSLILEAKTYCLFYFS